MSAGFQAALEVARFLDVLDREETSLAEEVAETEDPAIVAAAMEASRRRLAQEVDRVVRSLPTVLRGDLAASREIAYALVGTVDGRMLHRPTRGLDQWRERMLEAELYGSAIAGEEIVARARRATRAGEDDTLLAPVYLALFRSGFEGALRDDAAGLASLVASLEDAVGVRREGRVDVVPGLRPGRIPVPPPLLAGLGAATWLAAGFALWLALASEPLSDSARMADRIEAGLPAGGAAAPLERSIGPSGLDAADLDPEDRP